MTAGDIQNNNRLLDSLLIILFTSYCDLNIIYISKVLISVSQYHHRTVLLCDSIEVQFSLCVGGWKIPIECNTKLDQGDLTQLRPQFHQLVDSRIITFRTTPGSSTTALSFSIAFEPRAGFASVWG